MGWPRPARPPVTVVASSQMAASSASEGVLRAASLSAADVLASLAVLPSDGLSADEVVRRQARWGPNAVSSHQARLLPVLWHQLRSPLLVLVLVLLLTAAAAAYVVGERSAAGIIGGILGMSIGRGFLNEYRAEKAAESLHSEISHQTPVIRDATPGSGDVTALVPGDLVDLRLGAIVPADIRLLYVVGLECDESVLTGESLPVSKSSDAVGMLPSSVSQDSSAWPT